MKSVFVNLPKEQLKALRAAATRKGRSVNQLIREAIRASMPKPARRGPVAIWDGVPKRTSAEHD